MPRKLVWASEAQRDLREILEFVGERNLAAADRLYALIQAAGDRVLAMPLAYRSGRTTDTREAVVTPNYILVYRVMKDRVRILRILRILHSRQHYP